MCLLKALYGQITCTSVPWFPPVDAHSAYLISHILCEEEGDQHPCRPGRISHFALYLEAMQACGADTQPITQFLADLKGGMPIASALAAPHIPAASRRFVQATWQALSLPPHALAANFVFGREAITSGMFTQVVKQVGNTAPEQCAVLIGYLERHIELDSQDHLPHSLLMLENLCGQEGAYWQAAQVAAQAALQARLAFFSSIARQLVIEEVTS